MLNISTSAETTDEPFMDMLEGDKVDSSLPFSGFSCWLMAA